MAELTNPMVFEDDKKTLVNPMEFAIPTKALEDKLYFLFFYIFEDGNREEVIQQFEICRGRTAAYRKIENYLREYNIETEMIDLSMSFVLTETKEIDRGTRNEKYFMTGPDDRVSMYAFCKMMEDYYGASAFDVDEFKHNDEGGDDGRATSMFINEIYNTDTREFIMVDEGDDSLAQELMGLMTDAHKIDQFGGYFNRTPENGTSAPD